jgi:nucleoside-diphosphate-sugar epimerase
VKIHVTGGSGFLGGHVIPVLLQRGHEVSALARTTAAARRVGDLGASPIYGDLDDVASVDEAFTTSQAEVLVNLASLGFGHAPTIVAAAEDSGLRRATFVSTTSIFTKLDAPSKRIREMAENAVRESELEWTIVRPTMIYGAPGDRNLARLLSALRRWPAFPLPGGGRGLQQPVHVDDLSGAIATSIETSDAVHTSYDIAGPEPLTLRELVEEAAAAVGRDPRLFPLPLAPAIVVVRAYEAVARHPRIRAEQLRRLGEDKAFDITKAVKDLGYKPRSFRAGIRDEATSLL